MMKIFLSGMGIYLNWAVFIVSLAINIVRTAILDKDPFIHWGYLIIWFIINIVLAIVIAKYFMRNSVKIAGKMMKSSTKVAKDFFNEFEKEMK